MTYPDELQFHSGGNLKKNIINKTVLKLSFFQTPIRHPLNQLICNIGLFMESDAFSTCLQTQRRCEENEEVYPRSPNLRNSKAKTDSGRSSRSPAQHKYKKCKNIIKYSSPNMFI